jgi:hypothetical protein
MFQASGPVVRSFMRALREFAGLFAPVGDRANKVSRGPMQRFQAIGVSIGKFVGRSLNFVIDVVRNLIQFSTGLVKRWREWGPTINRSFSRVRESFVQLWGALRRIAALWADIGETGRQGKGGAEAMGSGFMDVLVPALLYAARVLEVVVWLAAKGGNAFVTLVRTMRSVASAITGIVNRIKVMFHNMRQAIVDAFDTIASRALRVYRLIPAPLRSGLGMSAVGNVLESRSTALEGRQQADINKAARVATVAGQVKAAGQPAVAAATAAAGGGGAAARVAATQEQALAAFRATAAAIQATVSAPINVQIDGETIVRATRAGARSASAGEFTPVGVGE